MILIINHITSLGFNHFISHKRLTSQEPRSNIPAICLNKKAKRGLSGLDPPAAWGHSEARTGFFEVEAENIFK